MPTPPQTGTLFVIGGAEDRRRDKEILGHFVNAAGGDRARLAVVATASTVPGELLEEYEQAFGDLGVSDIHLSYQATRRDAEDPKLLAALERASGVFLTGGDQLRLVSVLGGTEYARLLQRRFEDGLHIGGTSAGASAMSRVMIARGKARRAPRLSSVRLTPGLGLLEEIIVDQHFQERDRFGRLMAAVVHNPSMLGFGIDENTAFLVQPSGWVEVMGQGTLTIVDGRGLAASTVVEAGESEPIAFAGMSLHILRPGWRFDLNNRVVEVGVDQENGPSAAPASICQTSAASISRC